MTSYPFGAKRLTVVAVLAVQVACGGGSDASGPKHTPTSIEVNPSTTITAPSGSPQLERPSVIVPDKHAAPVAGVTVELTVTSRRGTVTGHTVQTGVDGVPTVSSWTLGTNAARNTVDASVAGL